MRLLRFFVLLRRGAGWCWAGVCLGGCAMDPPVFKSDKERREDRVEAIAAADAAAHVTVTRKPDHAVATVVMDLPGYVRTPYTHPPKLVNVLGMAPGSLVVCPFTGKVFNLPADFVDAPPSTAHPVPPQQHLELVPTGGARARAAGKLAARQAPVGVAAVAAARSPALPFARRVPGRPGLVFSPFAGQHQMVDVSGLAAGMEVKCPYTGRLFRVPGKTNDE